MKEVPVFDGPWTAKFTGSCEGASSHRYARAQAVLHYFCRVQYRIYHLES